jgi:parallel beta-helix repeat protein
MNKLMQLAIAFALAVVAQPAAAVSHVASDFFANCQRPSETGGHVFTVGPSLGPPNGFSNIGEALKAARPGDQINLMSGSYGELRLSGINTAGFITIVAAPGQRPLFSKLIIGGFQPASHWRLKGLTVTGFNTPGDKRAQTSLVTIANSDNIVLENNRISSAEGTVPWPIPEGVLSGVTARQVSCISLTGNAIHNVFNGIDFGGDQAGDKGKFLVASGNIIDNFAGDGIDHYGSHVRIEFNRITDGHDICNNQCVHNDGIQGWNYNGIPVLNTDIVIDSNIIIAQLAPGLPMPVDTLQGITIFDGRWDGVRIVNNLVVSNAWHGISLYGVQNASIINNTVVPTDPARNTWIMVHAAKGEAPGGSHTTLVRNNVFPGSSRNEPSGPGVTSDHNVALSDRSEYADNFTSFDPANFRYDLHPRKKSEVIGEGLADQAPKVDIEGNPRDRIDIGSYQGPK